MKPHILIAIADFYPDISAMLREGALRALEEAGATFEEVQVPGAFELPVVVRLAIESGEYDGYVALGCVIRGETTHYDYVCAESARGLNQLAMHHMAAIGYGILTVETMEQAKILAHPEEGNKGAAAVEACLAVISARQQFGIGE